MHVTLGSCGSSLAATYWPGSAPGIVTLRVCRQLSDRPNDMLHIQLNKSRGTTSHLAAAQLMSGV